MMKIPEDGYIYRMASIDNGSNTLGLSIIDLDLRSGELVVKYSETCTATKTAGRYADLAERHGDRFARFKVLREFLTDIFNGFDPDVVVVETPFMHRHPSAYAVLREAMMMITETVYDFDSQMELIGVTPMEAKRAVGAQRYDKGKDPIRTAVLELNDVYYENGINKELLDEHCIDSIAVSYYHAQEILKQLRRGQHHAP